MVIGVADVLFSPNEVSLIKYDHLLGNAELLVLMQAQKRSVVCVVIS